MYKLKKGTDSLYLGKGLFFFSNETYKEEQLEKVPEKAKEKYFETIQVEEQTNSGEGTGNALGFEVEDNTAYTESSLKKLKKDEQEEIISSLGLNPKDYNNEAERIEAILAATKAGE